MKYVAQVLGYVASYGLKADDALRAMSERVADEFALLVCRETGMKLEFLTHLKSRALECAEVGAAREPGPCKGRTKTGESCKKRTFFEYCGIHREQERALESKKRRVEAYVLGNRKPDEYRVVAPARFIFS